MKTNWLIIKFHKYLNLWLPIIINGNKVVQLPEEQKVQIVQALPSDMVIKILRENELLTDCIQFKHYEAWFDQQYKKEAVSEKAEKVKSGSFKLALD